MRKREKSPGFSSKGSTMKSMVDSRKIHMVGAGIEAILDEPRITQNPVSSRRRFHLAPSGPGEEGSCDEGPP